MKYDMLETPHCKKITDGAAQALTNKIDADILKGILEAARAMDAQPVSNKNRTMYHEGQWYKTDNYGKVKKHHF